MRSEYKEPYPNWALFFGAVIVLSSTLSIPAVLVVRLIAKLEARDQMQQFFEEKKALLVSTWMLIRGCRTRSYSPQVDEEVNESHDIPYEAANGSHDPSHEVSNGQPLGVQTEPELEAHKGEA